MYTPGVVRNDRGDRLAQRASDLYGIVVMSRVVLIEQQRHTTFGVVQHPAQCLQQLRCAPKPNEVGACDD